MARSRGFQAGSPMSFPSSPKLNLEAGRVEAQRRTVRKLARALEVDPADLVE